MFYVAQLCPLRLWFDVERRYKTIDGTRMPRTGRLWFDVERRYKTIQTLGGEYNGKLWFDVERQYNIALNS